MKKRLKRAARICLAASPDRRIKSTALQVLLSVLCALLTAYAAGLLQEPALAGDAFPAQLHAMRVAMCFSVPAMALFYFVFFRHWSAVEKTGLILAAVFTLCLINARSMESSELTEIFLPKGNAIVFVGTALFIYAVIQYVFSAFDRAVERPFNKVRVNTEDEARIFLISAAVILLGWLPGMALCYPGSTFADTVSQIKMGLGMMRTGASNPVLVTYLYGFLFKLGQSTNDERAIFMIVLCQNVINACAMSLLSLQVWRTTKSKAAWIATVIFFGFLPVWCNAAQLVVKDVLHTGFFLFFCLAFQRCIPQKKDAGPSVTDTVLFGISGVFVMLTRKGTFYLVALCGAALILANRRRSVKALLVCLGAIVALFVTANQVVYPLLGFYGERKVENYSLPLQQMAYFLKEKGDVLTPEEIAVVNETADFQGMIDGYTPMISDPVKLTFHGEDQDNSAFFRLYFRLFARYPLVFLKALVMNVFEHFNPWFEKVAIRVFIQEDPTLYHAKFANDALKYKMALYWQGWLKVPVLRLLIGTGLYAWINMLLFGYAIRSRARNAVLGLLPSLLLLSGLLLSHVNGEIRYGYPLIAATPLMIVYVTDCIWRQRREKTDAGDTTKIISTKGEEHT